jgi:uncharacterized repeat protein (TIGR03803 family)
MAWVRHGVWLGLFALAEAGGMAAVAAPTQTTLFNFAGGSGPAYPSGRLLQGANGVLYGVSQSGGSAGSGTVYALSPPSGGQGAWSVQVIYSFLDSDQPNSGLISDANGVLYGTTEEGGAPGKGTVFSLTPPAGGQGAWTEATLYTFMAGKDGAFPAEDAGLTMDASGALYGTTINGGEGHGTAFRLSPPAAGKTVWTETILHSFKGADDGYFPEGGLLAGAGGVFYGTTSGGGKSFTCNGNACGTLFSLTPPAGGNGKWVHHVLRSFINSGGSFPVSSLISDAGGNLYGTAELGGGSTACSLGCGTVYRLIQGKQQTLHVFTSGTDSEFPTSVLVMGSDGTLWGAASGASPNRLGATFSLKPPAGGKKAWTETIVHTFQGGDTDGATPSAGLTQGAGGVLYGVTMEGGDGSRGLCGNGCGTMFQITP